MVTYAYSAESNSTSAEVFRNVMGTLVLQLIDSDEKFGAKTFDNRIEINTFAEANTNKFQWNIVHEFGHVIDTKTFDYAENRLGVEGVGSSR